MSCPGAPLAERPCLLKDAQENYRIAIFWEHNLQALEDFVVHAR